MNIPPSEAERMSLGDYEALVWNWNEAHNTSGIEPADHALTQKLVDRINSDPLLIH